MYVLANHILYLHLLDKSIQTMCVALSGVMYKYGLDLSTCSQSDVSSNLRIAIDVKNTYLLILNS